MLRKIDYQRIVSPTERRMQAGDAIVWRGDVGPRGASSGIPYTFDTSTAMADPGAGLLRLNHASTASATAIALDDTSAALGNPSVAAWLSAMALSTNAVKGTLTLVARDTPSIFAIYHVAAVSADVGWKQADVTYVDGAGVFTAGLACQVMFDRDGNAGVDGDVYATAGDVAAILGADSGFQSLVAGAAGGGNQQYVGAESVESKSYVPGGLKRLTSGANVGALQIKLPLTTADTGQWVTFWIDCYNYSPQASCSFLISAYIYVNAGSPTWVSPTVRQIGGDRRHPVTLGNDGTNRCIQIGDLTYNWGYPIFRVRDVSGNTGANWTTLTTTAWVLTVTASALASVYQTVYDGVGGAIADNGALGNDTTTNLNDHVKFGGFWNKHFYTGAPNLPSAGLWQVEYQRSSDTYGVQVAWPGYNNTSAPQIRRVTAGTWGSWKALAWADDPISDDRLSFTVSAFAKNVLDDPDASTWRATVGAISQADGDARWAKLSGAAFTGAVSMASSLDVTGTFWGHGACHFGYGTAGAALVYVGYNRSAAGQATLFLYADNAAPTSPSATIARSAGTNAAFTITQTGTGGINLVPGSGGLKRDGYTILDINNRPDGTQALALAGADASQRSWKATDLKDAARHWARVLPDFVAVTEAGATGDGSTLETATIQAVIDSMSKGTVFLPPGSYLVDSLVLKEGVALRGAPGGSSILKANSNAINLLTMSASSGTKAHVDIADLKFNGNGKTNVTAVYLDGASSGNRISYVKLAKLHVIDCNEGLHLFYCANNTIDDCFVTGTAFGVHLHMCADTDVFGTKVQNGSNAGFYIAGGAGAYDEGVRLIGCSTNGQQIGLWVNGQDWGIANGCSFTTSAGGSGIFQSATNWSITGSEFAVAGGTPAAAGINIDSSCSDFTVTGNKIQLCTYGIFSAGARINVIGNALKANSNVDIYLNATTKSVINNNICDSTGVAWSILEAGAADYNNAQGNTGNGLFTKVGTNSQFANNLTY